MTAIFISLISFCWLGSVGLSADPPLLDDLDQGRDLGRAGALAPDQQGIGVVVTLRHGLGQAWTAETKAAWTEAYALLAGVMLPAGSSSEAAA